MALFGAKQSGVKKTAAPKKNDQPSETKEIKNKPEAELSMQELYSADGGDKKNPRTKKASAVSRYDGAFRVLDKPLITEKATELGTQNKYAFVVSKASNKIEVAKSIYAVYGVKPVSVNIICMQGKAVTRGRIKGKRKDWKKAIVTLKKGDSIKIYEGV
jgi:large subunit ribosomal protein L23